MGELVARIGMIRQLRAVAVQIPDYCEAVASLQLRPRPQRREARSGLVSSYLATMLAGERLE